MNLLNVSCPIWTVPGVLGFGGFDIDVQCSSIMTTIIYPIAKATILMVAGLASVRMSIF